MLRARATGHGVRQEGNLIRAWGGPGQGYDWPENEHGIHVDPKGFVWIAGNEKDGQILKFTREGKFVLQIGKPGPQTTSSDTTRLGRPANMEVDAATNEVYVADGYYNHRIIVFDAGTGVYKRHWGAYGKPPTDEKLAPYNPVARPLSSSAIQSTAYKNIARRTGLRLRPDQRQDPGLQEGRHVREGVHHREEHAGQRPGGNLISGRTPRRPGCSMPMAPTTKCARSCGKPVRSSGPSAATGGGPAIFTGSQYRHDSRGNVFTTEVDTGKRAQKFRFLGEIGGAAPRAGIEIGTPARA